MSAPDSNVEKQARRHRGPLVGIVVAAIIALIVGLWIRSNNNLTEADDAPIEAGETVEGAAPATE